MYKELEAVYEEVSVENTANPTGTKKQKSTWARLIKIHLSIILIGIRYGRKGLRY